MTTQTDLFREAARSFGITGMDFCPPTDHYATINSLRMHYVDWGGSGYPLLFLHGGGLTCRTWDMTIVQIREKYHCYALDLRNHGDSDHVEGPRGDSGAMTGDIRGFVEHLRLKECVIIGMSMGGMAAMWYGSKYPKELRAMVFVDITPTVKQGQGREKIQRLMSPVEWDNLDQAVASAMGTDQARSEAPIRYGLQHSLRQREDGKWVWKHTRRLAPGQTQSRLAPTEEQQKAQEASREQLWKDVARISCPTLVVHGGRSLITDRELADRLALTVSRGEAVTIPGAGHTVQGDKPKELVAELTKFLDKYDI